MLDQMECLQSLFGDGHGNLPVDLPAFPQANGEVVSKEWVVKSVEVLAGMLGIPLTAPDGERAFGGHTFRVSGARHSLGRNYGSIICAKHVFTHP